MLNYIEHLANVNRLFTVRWNEMEDVLLSSVNWASIICRATSCWNQRSKRVSLVLLLLLLLSERTWLNSIRAARKRVAQMWNKVFSRRREKKTKWFEIESSRESLIRNQLDSLGERPQPWWTKVTRRCFSLRKVVRFIWKKKIDSVRKVLTRRTDSPKEINVIQRAFITSEFAWRKRTGWLDDRLLFVSQMKFFFLCKTKQWQLCKLVSLDICRYLFERRSIGLWRRSLPQTSFILRLVDQRRHLD